MLCCPRLLRISPQVRSYLTCGLFVCKSIRMESINIQLPSVRASENAVLRIPAFSGLSAVPRKKKKKSSRLFPHTNEIFVSSSLNTRGSENAVFGNLRCASSVLLSYVMKQTTVQHIDVLSWRHRACVFFLHDRSGSEWRA